MTDYNSKAQLELIDKQAQLLKMMSTPVMMVTERTLRDEFAMAALTGIMSRHDNLMPETVAEIAIRYADAMMEARK